MSASRKPIRLVLGHGLAATVAKDFNVSREDQTPSRSKPSARSSSMMWSIRTRHRPITVKSYLDENEKRQERTHVVGG